MGKLLNCHLKGKACKKLVKMDRILYSEKKMASGFHLPLNWDYYLKFSNMLIGIYSRSQVNIFRTIGPLVLIFASNIDCRYTLEPANF